MADLHIPAEAPGVLRQILVDLEAFTACLWDLVPLDRREFHSVRSVARVHERGITVESCQRLEVFSIGGCQCDAPARAEGVAALEHLAEVAAGLHSVVLGESEILGQVRTALASAPAAIRPYGDVAIAAARELRRETTFDSHTGHLLDRALRQLEIPGRGTLLVVGTGHVARQVASRGPILGFERVVIAGRRQPDGAWFSTGGYTFVPLAEMTSVNDVAVAVGCLGSDAPELCAACDLPAVSDLVLDLGTPRNFAGDAGVPQLGIAELLVGDQRREHSETMRTRLRERLAEILERRLAMLETDSATAVGQMRAAVERVRQRELARYASRHPEVPPELLDTITRSLVNKIMHLPSERLRQLDDAALGRQLALLFEPAPGDE